LTEHKNQKDKTRGKIARVGGKDRIIGKLGKAIHEVPLVSPGYIKHRVGICVFIFGLGRVQLMFVILQTRLIIGKRGKATH